jgi:hypothetical protein
VPTGPIYDLEFDTGSANSRHTRREKPLFAEAAAM